MKPSTALRLALCAGLTASISALPAGAQCNQWSQDFALPGGSGTDGAVHAFAVFDQSPVAAPYLFVGGDFTQAGTTAADHVARWNGETWTALGSGIDGSVYALAVYDDGLGGGPALYAGGQFTLAGGNPANSIARWDGASWSALDTGMDGPVYALHVFGGELYAGGGFSTAGGTGASFIARWDGLAWSALTTGTDMPVRSFAVYDDGLGGGPALIVGGEFALAGGMAADHVARWNGSAWSLLGLGINRTAFALAVYDDGSGPGVYAGGSYTVANGSLLVNHIARWDGVTWTALGLGTDSVVYALATHDDGSGEKLYVGGNSILHGGAPANYVASWDGSNWAALGAGTDLRVRVLAVYDDLLGRGPALYAGGEFANAGGAPSSFIGRWERCPDAQAYCFGDGIDPLVTTDCPCLNFGAPGRGCGNSVHPIGALLTRTGTTSPDTIQLSAFAIPPGVGSIYLQGSVNVPAGIVFGDGVRCAGGVLTRLGLKNDLDFDGSTTLGPATGDPLISVNGGVIPGNTYYYQAYYRNPNPAWCPPLTFNVTQGYPLTW